jgi:tetratricopeptide (TPR) repeat protein
MAQIHIQLSEIYVAGGRLSAAEAECRLGLSLGEELVHAHPETAGYAIALASARAGMGLVRLKAGKPEEALDWYARALPPLEGVLRADPRHRRARKAQARLHARRAWALRPLKRQAEALEEWDKALALAEGKLREEYRADRARTLMHLGRPADALREAAELEANPSLASGTLYGLAAVHALASAAAKADAPAAESQAARALELLAKARSADSPADPDDVRAMKEDEDLAPLRSRPEFRRLLGNGTKKP